MVSTTTPLIVNANPTKHNRVEVTQANAPKAPKHAALIASGVYVPTQFSRAKSYATTKMMIATAWSMITPQIPAPIAKSQANLDCAKTVHKHAKKENWFVNKQTSHSQQTNATTEKTTIAMAVSMKMTVQEHNFSRLNPSTMTSRKTMN